MMAAWYVQGSAWDSYAPSYKALVQNLDSAVDEIHHAAVVHGDLNASNILVTPDSHVLVVDFAKAVANPTDEILKAEKECIQFI